MQLVVTGVHLDISDSFRQRVSDSLVVFNEKHAIDPIEVDIRLSKEVPYKFRLDITYRPSHGVVIHGYGEAEDAYAAFENALHLLTERIRRQKKRLAANHKRAGALHAPEASYFVLGAEEPDDESLSPPVIAELKADVPTLTVSEAVMRLDLADKTAMLFYNEGHGRLNMVYRRPDGNIGWVDPN